MPKEKKDYKLNKLSFVNENMLVKTCTQASNIIYYIDDLHIMGKFLFMSSFCMLKTGANTLFRLMEHFLKPNFYQRKNSKIMEVYLPLKY